MRRDMVSFITHSKGPQWHVTIVFWDHGQSCHNSTGHRTRVSMERGRILG